jgi:hypothetical protein
MIYHHRDWFPVDQSPNINPGSYNGLPPQPYQGVYPAGHGIDNARLYPGMLNLTDSPQYGTDEDYDVNSNPHIRNNYKVLQERTRLIHERSGSIVLDQSRGPPMPLYSNSQLPPLASQAPTITSSIAAANSSASSVSASSMNAKPTSRRKLTASNSNESSPISTEESKALQQRAAIEQQEKLAIFKKAQIAYSGNSTGKEKGISPATSASSRHQSPPMPVASRSRSSSGIASVGHESDVVNLSMAASTLASIASPPSSKAHGSSNIVHSSGLPKGPSSSVSAAYKNIQCNCKKSRCLKLYCDCFRMDKYCDGCNCNDCANIVGFLLCFSID